MASKKAIIEKLQMELWVMDRVGIPRDTTLSMRCNQKKQLTGMRLTIGEALLLLKELGAERVIYRGSEIPPR